MSVTLTSVGLIACGVAYVVGLVLLLATRHEADRAEKSTVRYYVPGRFNPLPFAFDTAPRPIHDRSWLWQLGLGLTPVPTTHCRGVACDQVRALSDQVRIGRTSAHRQKRSLSSAHVDAREGASARALTSPAGTPSYLPISLHFTNPSLPTLLIHPIQIPPQSPSP
jgi:hypothetical protein